MLQEEDENGIRADDVPIELRHLEAEGRAAEMELELLLNDPSVLEAGENWPHSNINLNDKSKSVSDLLNMLPKSLFNKLRKSNEEVHSDSKSTTSEIHFSEGEGLVKSRSTVSCSEPLEKKSVSFSTHSLDSAAHKTKVDAFHEALKQIHCAGGSTDSTASSSLSRENNTERTSSLTSISEVLQPNDEPESDSSVQKYKSNRPLLVKQKQSIQIDSDTPPNNEEKTNTSLPKSTSDTKTLPSQYAERKMKSFPPSSKKKYVYKQTSLNEELLQSARSQEKQQIRQQIPKQMSLNEEMLGKEKTEKSSNVFISNLKRLQMLKEKLTTPSPNDTGVQSTLKNGLVRMIQTWRGDAPQQTSRDENPPPTSPSNNFNLNNETISSYRRNLYRKTFHPSERRDSAECDLTLYPVPDRCCCECGSVRETLSSETTETATTTRDRKVSEDSSDSSSKENSLQSDTSMDSEDSFVSVIYIPKPDEQKLSISSESDPSSPHSPPCGQTSPGVAPKVAATGNPLRRISPPTDSAMKTTKKSFDQPDVVDVVGDVSTVKTNAIEPIEPIEIKETDEVPVKCMSEPRPVDQRPKMSSLVLGENIEIIRKPNVQGLRNVQVVRKCIPKFLTFDVFNPEVDDTSESSVSSSPSSTSSVISMIHDDTSEKMLHTLEEEISISQRLHSEKILHTVEEEVSPDKMLQTVVEEMSPDRFLDGKDSKDDAANNEDSLTHKKLKEKCVFDFDPETVNLGEYSARLNYSAPIPSFWVF